MATEHRLAGEGPREKLMSKGAASLTDVELLAITLHTGYRECSVQELARELFSQFGDIRGLMRASQTSLMACPGIGPAKYAQLQAAIELARRQALESVRECNVLSSPEETRRFLQHHLACHSREVFTCLFLDSQNRVLGCEDLFFGTLDGAAVYPREVAVRALHNRAAAVIFAHNHPSGIAEPSGADRRITTRLTEALALLDIRVLDHIIVGSGQEFSFAAKGLL